MAKGMLPGGTQADYPTAIRNIPDSWWDVLLDGKIWVVDLDRFSFRTTLDRFSDAVRYRAHKRGLKASVRMDYRLVTERILLVQAFPGSESMTGRLGDPEDAYQAPDLPPRTKYQPATRPHAIPKPVSYADLIGEMLAFQQQHDLPAVAPVDLVDHPNQLVQHLARSCNCGTRNIRWHDRTCEAYPVVGVFYHELRRMPVPPERWVTPLTQSQVVSDSVKFRSPSDGP